MLSVVMINAVMLSVLLSNVVALGRGKEEGQGWGWNPRGADFEIFFRRYPIKMFLFVSFTLKIKMNAFHNYKHK
jgi:hypothetical protein